MMSAIHTLGVTHAVTLAADLDQDKVTPGLLGFVVFAVMGGAVWLLMKSMSKHMKKVDFAESSPSGADDKGDGGDGAAARATSVPKPSASSEGKKGSVASGGRTAPKAG